MSSNKAPGFAQHPDHRVVVTPETARVRVTVDGVVVADSRRTQRLDESKYAAVYYIPRTDVRMDLLTRTQHATRCPFKGEASYYSLKSGDRTIENAVWTYETPYDEVTAIKDHLAFYGSKVDSIRVDPA
jgi:uncharacterized protein (DUF427 family)